MLSYNITYYVLLCILHCCSINRHVVERWLQCKFWADRSPICWSGANATVLWTISMFTTKYHQQSVEYSFPGLDVFWWNHRWTNIQDERSSNWLASYFFWTPSPTFLREVLKEQWPTLFRRYGTMVHTSAICPRTHRCRHCCKICGSHYGYDVLCGGQSGGLGQGQETAMDWSLWYMNKYGATQNLARFPRSFHDTLPIFVLNMFALQI